MTLNPVILTRRQLEALRDADRNGNLPHAIVGLRIVSFLSLAEQLLAAMDENARLRSALETHVPPAP